MILELFDWDSVTLVHLHALDQEEAGFDANRFLKRQLVATVIDLGNQVLHLVTMEGSDTDEHFVQHDAQGPRINFLTIATLFKKLRT